MQWERENVRRRRHSQENEGCEENIGGRLLGVLGRVTPVALQSRCYGN